MAKDYYECMAMLTVTLQGTMEHDSRMESLTGWPKTAFMQGSSRSTRPWGPILRIKIRWNPVEMLKALWEIKES